MHALLQEILDEVRPLLGQGRVASYIPALADVAPDQLGIAVCSADGEVFEAGDAQTPFSIQSISKVFSLVQAIGHRGESLWERLGHEPSGQPFNSLVQLEFERGRPRNPFIIFRSFFSAFCAGPGLSQQVLSQRSGAAWQALQPGDRVKAYFERLAEDEKRAHRAAHPDYKYQPGPPRKRQQAAATRQSAKQVTDFWTAAMTGAAPKKRTRKKRP